MAEYIEKQALLKKMYASHSAPLLMGHTTDEDIMFKTMVSIVEEQPSADVVEVVRCKDCEHNKYEQPNGIIHCHRDRKEGWIFRKTTDYCSYGERKCENGRQ